MKIKLIWIGKTENGYLKQGIDEYLGRLKHYLKVEVVEIPALKQGRMNPEQQKKVEGELLLRAFGNDHVILLDEKGKQVTSEGMAQMIQQFQLRSLKAVAFVIGGPFGFSKEVYGRANGQLGLSKMTFSHQMIRLLFTEQVYRAMTIIKGEKYHHS